MFLTYVVLWADVMGRPDDQQVIRKFVQDGVISTDLDVKERGVKRAGTLFSEHNVVDTVDFLNIYGGWVQGRQTYATRMNSPQARAAFDGRTREAIVESIRFLRHDVAIAIVRFHNERQAVSLLARKLARPSC